VADVLDYWAVTTIRRERIFSQEWFASRAKALEAAGLQEEAMSQENVEVIRSMYRPGDPTRFFDLLDEDVEVDVSQRPLVPDHSDLIRGKHAAIEFYRHYWGTWADYILEPDEILDAGNGDVVVVQRERGQGKGSGVP
jgi:hypothetical protein